MRLPSRSLVMARICSHIATEAIAKPPAPFPSSNWTGIDPGSVGGLSAGDAHDHTAVLIDGIATDDHHRSVASLLRIRGGIERGKENVSPRWHDGACFFFP